MAPRPPQIQLLARDTAWPTRSSRAGAALGRAEQSGRVPCRVQLTRFKKSRRIEGPLLKSWCRDVSSGRRLLRSLTPRYRWLLGLAIAGRHQVAEVSIRGHNLKPVFQP